MPQSSLDRCARLELLNLVRLTPGAVGPAEFRGVERDGMSCCRVDAGGVTAEWVEVTPAAEDQRTLVYFLRQRDAGDVVRSARPMAERLAAATGGRVLAVNCGTSGQIRPGNAIEAGLRAYAWLLGEGCDVALTTFVSSRSDHSMVRRILRAAARRGLPAPACGLCFDTALTHRGQS